MRSVTRSRLLLASLLVMGVLACSPIGAGVSMAGGPPQQTFPDVPASYWAFVQIENLAAIGVVRGFFNGFRPEQFVTRAQMAVFISRAIEAKGRTGWAQPGLSPNTILVIAPVLSTAPMTDFQLLESVNGLTFAAAANATLLELDDVNGFITWGVTDVTSTRYYLPVVEMNGVLIPLTSVVQARPTEAQTAITITQPGVDATDEPVLPVIRWNPVDDDFGTVMYIVTVSTTGTTPTAIYEVGLEAWRTFVMFNQLRGPGVIFSTSFVPFLPEPLLPNTDYTVTVMAIDTTGWAFANGSRTFTTTATP